MTVFAGHYGSIEFKRIGSDNRLDLQVSASDIYFARKRFALGGSNGLDIPFGTITTGDRVRISTDDPRGLPFRLYTNVNNTTYIDYPGSDVSIPENRRVGPIEFYANVDTLGAISMYRNFADAIANPKARYLAIPLEQAQGTEPWSVKVNLLPGDFHELGQVQGFTFNTDRETIDISSLGEKYKNFSSSAITGAGTVDCLFSFKNITGEEIPLALAQLIQKIEIGSRFEGKFYILEPGLPQPPGYAALDGVFYEVNGILTKSAFTMRADQIAECSFDFISAGEFKLRAGVSPTDLTTEDNVIIGRESTLDELGVLLENS